MKPPARWFVEALAVQTFRGESSTGRVYDGPVDFLGQVEHKRKVVLNAEGDEVVSDFTVRALPAYEHLLTEGSIVEHNGRKVTLLAVRTYTVRGEPAYVEGVA